MDNQSILQKFADDERTFEAVKGELLESEFKELNSELSNELLGQEVKARLKARELVEIGFRKIKQLKTNEKVVKQMNPGR